MNYRSCLLAILCFSCAASGLEVSLEPVPRELLGDWARVALPFRLHPLTPPGASYDGPPLASELWGELSLGDAQYTLLLGVRHGGAVDFWLSDDGRMRDGDELSGERGPEHLRWGVEVVAKPPGGEPYPYALSIIWPEGRGYLFVEGGAPRRGELVLDDKRYTVVLVDGDVAGVFGTERDFYAVDWTLDGELHAEPGGHERFAVDEAFTVGEQSFAVEQIAPDGTWMRLSPTDYRPPKVPLLPGYPAPDFTFRPFPDRSEVSLAEFRGKAVLLDFWATWCLPCMEELPRLKEIHRTYRHEGFEIIGVSLDTSAEELGRVLEEQEIPWPQYFDGKGWENAVAELYRVHATPHLILLDQEGIVHAVNPPLEELPSLIEVLLGVTVLEDPEEKLAPPDPDPAPEREQEEFSQRFPLWPLLLALGVGVAVLLWMMLQGR